MLFRLWGGTGQARAKLETWLQKLLELFPEQCRLVGGLLLAAIVWLTRQVTLERATAKEAGKELILARKAHLEDLRIFSQLARPPNPSSPSTPNSKRRSRKPNGA